LAANTYTLSAIETVITGDRNSNVYDDPLREQHQPGDDG
jgi:hypothetical protein